MPRDMVNPDVDLVRLRTSDTGLIESANTLLNRTQGNGLFSVEGLIGRIEKPEAIGLACISKGDLMAAGFAEVVGSLDYYEPFDAGIAGRLAGKKIGSLSTVSVEERWQGHGFGQLLARARLDHLRSVGCDWILSVSWVSGQSHTSRHVFDKLGFRRVGEVPHFFRESALANPFACPGCRRHPCECGAILYEFDFS